MSKNRHIHTIPNKYGHDDVFDETMEYFKTKLHKECPKALFDKLPYIGFLRIPASSEFGDWWYDTNDDMVNAKVIRVNDTTVDYIHYDSHHNDIVHKRVEFDGYGVEGNVLIKTQ